MIAAMCDVRVGIGYDVHRLVEGRRLVLGGVEIPYDCGLLGHSDADALSHAVTDAVLGALALGDLGQHFPDYDERWKDADSLCLLQHAADLTREHGYVVGNVDAVVVAERPRIGPYVTGMRERLAAALGIPTERVSVKATTNEGLDAVGACEAIAARAVVLVRRLET
jgi:2-C-methyl-D-erythritol 2,4-cyclodiphosphate synthase